MARRKPGQRFRTEEIDQAKFATVMREFAAGDLTSRGRTITDEDQAKAIAASEGHREFLRKRREARRRRRA